MRNLEDKFSALFHDPLNKSLILSTGKNHEEEAKELTEELQIPWEITDKAKLADQIASSMERIFITKGMKADFSKSPQVTHPLAGENKKIAGINDKSIEEIRTTIKDAFNKLSNFSHSGVLTDDFYIFLWAYMKKIIMAEGKGLEEFWEKTPADTRIPDHSIWDHLFSTSAIAGALPKTALLVFSITPVQSFITTARKTRDFWMGSYILSWLTWKAMEVIVEEYGPDAIIFPELHDQPFVKHWLLGRFSKLSLNEPIKKILNDDKKSLRKELLFPTIPNRFVAFVDWENGKERAEEAEKAAKEEFKKMADFVKKEIDQKANLKFDQTFNSIWDRQIENYFDITWSIVPFRLDEDVLRGENKEVEAIIGKVEKCYKNIPEFAAKIIEVYKKWEKKLQYPANVGFLYPVIYDIAERIAGAQKGLRTKRMENEEGFKCTLCGEREVLHPVGKERWGELNKFWGELKQSLGNLGNLLREDEKLCAVCLTKRFATLYFDEKFKDVLEDASFTNSFPSTADMAVFSFKKKVLENVSKKEIKKAVEDFINAVEKIPEIKEHLGYVKNPILLKLLKKSSAEEFLYKFASLDGEWLFEERYSAERRENQGLPKEVLKKAREKLGKLKDKLKISPGKYYAILKLDGDYMGKTLKGEKNSPAIEHYHPKAKESLIPVLKEDLEGIPRPISIPVHRAISSALRNYSLELVPKIVEEAGGKLVFSGGDDVFALLPLEELLPTVEKLRAAFSGEINWREVERNQGYISKEKSGWVWKDGKPLLTMGKDASASLGVAIVHWEWPLSMAIKEAQRAEDDAKKIRYKKQGKNAFFISFVRRSGAKRRAGFKFYVENGEKGRIWIIHNILLKLQRLFEEKKFSRSSVYNFSLVFSKVLEEKPTKDLLKVFKDELIRIAGRGKSKEEKKKIKDKVDEIFQLLDEGEAFFPEIKKEKGYEKLPLKNFTDALEILAFLAKGGEE